MCLNRKQLDKLQAEVAAINQGEADDPVKKALIALATQVEARDLGFPLDSLQDT